MLSLPQLLPSRPLHLHLHLNPNVEQCRGQGHVIPKRNLINHQLSQGRGDGRVMFYRCPAYPRLTLTSKDRNPALSLPQLLINQDLPPTQLGATTSSSETDNVPSRPFHLHLHLQPANKNQRQLLSRKPNKQHNTPRKPLPAHPSKTLGRAHGQLLLVLNKRPTRHRDHAPIPISRQPHTERRPL